MVGAMQGTPEQHAGALMKQRQSPSSFVYTVVSANCNQLSFWAGGMPTAAQVLMPTAAVTCM
jgi:hypothetical protein